MKEIVVKLKRYEKRLSNRNYKEFERMFNEFHDIVKNDNSNFSTFSKINIDYDKFMELAKEYLTTVFEFNVKSVAETYNRLFGWGLAKYKLSGIKDKLVTEYGKKYAAEKVAQITETTRKILNNVIVGSQSEGLGIKGIMNNVLSSIKDMSKIRAKTIARTETSSAINNTSFTTAKVAKMKKKGWVHIGGQYQSRENHKRLNGKYILMEELFDLGEGIRARFPHDPKLPAKELINCNCLIIFK